MKQIVDGLDESVEIMMGATQDAFLSGMVYWNLGQFVDYENASCKFDSTEFKSLLEMSKRLPANFDARDSDGDVLAYSDSDEMQKLQSGDLLLTSSYSGEATIQILLISYPRRLAHFLLGIRLLTRWQN